MCGCATLLGLFLLPVMRGKDIAKEREKGAPNSFVVVKNSFFLELKHSRVNAIRICSYFHSNASS